MSSTNKSTTEFISLITEYQTSLRGYIVSLMPGMQGASDVLQETNIVLWEKRNSFELGSNFSAWAFSIARYEVKKHKSRLKHWQNIRSLDEKLSEELAERCQRTPQEMQTRLDALEGCLKKLNSSELKLIKTRYAADTTLKTYADSTGKSAGSLRVTLHRIREKLRKCVSFQLETQS